MDSGALFGVVWREIRKHTLLRGCDIHCITAMAFSICNMASVRCSMGVRFSEGPLWEVPLYVQTWWLTLWKKLHVYGNPVSPLKTLLPLLESWPLFLS